MRPLQEGSSLLDRLQEKYSSESIKVLLVSLDFRSQLEKGAIPFVMEAASFTLKNVDGSLVAVDDYESANGYIIVFTCNTCPYSRGYLYDEDQVVSKKYGPLRTPHVFLLERTGEGNIVLQWSSGAALFRLFCDICSTCRFAGR